jgi:hypothetical protein
MTPAGELSEDELVSVCLGTKITSVALMALVPLALSACSRGFAASGPQGGSSKTNASLITLGRKVAGTVHSGQTLWFKIEPGEAVEAKRLFLTNGEVSISVVDASGETVGGNSNSGQGSGGSSGVLALTTPTYVIVRGPKVATGDGGFEFSFARP